MRKSVLEMDEDGGLSLVIEDNQEEALGALLISGGYLCLQSPPPVSYPLVYRHQQLNSVARTRLSLPALLKRYGLADPVLDWMQGRAGDIEATIQVSLAGEAGRCWHRTPRDRQALFYDQLLRVSQSVHDTMRRWTAYFYLQDLSRLEDFRFAYALLTFSEIREFRSKKRAEFTYDIMNLDDLQRALRNVTRPLTERFTEIRRRLENEGRTSLMPFFTIRRGTQVVRGMHKLPKELGVILQAEIQIVGAFLDLANRASSFPDHVDQVFPSGTSLAEALQIRLRRIFPHPSFPGLASLMMIEATQALAAIQGESWPLRVLVRMREQGTGAERLFITDVLSVE